MDYVAGYTVVHDVSARDWQLRKNSGQWLIWQDIWLILSNWSSHSHQGFIIRWMIQIVNIQSNEEWSSQLWSQFLQLRKEAWKKFRTSTGLEPVTSRYRCDALPTELWSHWRWEQVNFGFICSRERYVSEWCIWNKSYVNCRYEIKWRMILAVYNSVKKPEKNSGLQRDLNPWPGDTGAMLYQLSYEATDVGSRSIVGSYASFSEHTVK